MVSIRCHLFHLRGANEVSSRVRERETEPETDSPSRIKPQDEAPFGLVFDSYSEASIDSLGVAFAAAFYEATSGVCKVNRRARPRARGRRDWDLLRISRCDAAALFLN